MARRKHQHYTEEFRKEAVKRSEQPGVTQAEVAKELGISVQQISNWKRQFNRLSEKQFNTLEGVDYSKQESEEIRALRRQNKRLEEEMESLVRDTYEPFEAAYGAPRLTNKLNDLGFPCSLNDIAKIMADQGIKARNGKGFNYSRHSLTMNHVSDNLLWRDFKADQPNQKWTSDITYIWGENSWLYLATVMDLHSDRGTQYRSKGYIDYLKSKGCKISMSRKGNCWEGLPHEVLWVQRPNGIFLQPPES